MAFNGDFGTSSEDLAPNYDFYTAGLQQSGVLPGSWQMRQAYHGGNRALGATPSTPGFETTYSRDVNTRLGVGRTNWNSNSPTTNKVQNPGPSYLSQRTSTGSREEATLDRFFGGLGKMKQQKKSSNTPKSPKPPAAPPQGPTSGSGGGSAPSGGNVNSVSSGNQQSFGGDAMQSGNIAGGSQFINSPIEGNMGNIGNINYGGNQTNLGAYARQTNMHFGFDQNHPYWNGSNGGTPPPSPTPAGGSSPKPLPSGGGAAVAIGRGPSAPKALAAAPAASPSTTAPSQPAASPATSGASPSATFTVGGTNPTSVGGSRQAYLNVLRAPIEKGSTTPTPTPIPSWLQNRELPTNPTPQPQGATGQGFVPFGELGPGAPSVSGPVQPAPMGPIALGPASSTPQYGGRGPVYGGVKGPNRIAAPTGVPGAFSPYSAAAANGYNTVPQTSWYQNYQNNTMNPAPAMAGAGAPANQTPFAPYSSPLVQGATGYNSVPTTGWYQSYMGGQAGMPTRHDFLPGGGRLRSDYEFGGAPAQGPTHPTPPTSNRTPEQQADFELKRQEFNRRSRRPGT